MISMRQEAAILERVIAGGGEQARVLPPPITFQTSKTRIYYLAVGGDPRSIGRIERMEPAMNQQLTLARGCETLVRIERNPLRIEVARPDPVAVPVKDVLMGMVRKGGGRPLALLGESYDFDRIARPGERRQARPSVLDLAHESTPHLLVAGATGSGKTKLLQGMALGLGVADAPDQVRLVILDPKGRDFRAFDLMPHLAAPVVTDAGRCVAALGALVQEMDRRKQAAASFAPDTPLAAVEAALGPSVVVVVDELAELVQVGGSDVEATVRRLLQVGRGLKIHLILATQYPTADFVGGLAKDKANLPARVIGRVSRPEDAKAATGIAGSEVGANKLVPGDFILVLHGRMRRFHACHLRDDDLLPAVRGIAKLWRGAAPGLSLDLNPAQPDTAQTDAQPSAASPQNPVNVRHNSGQGGRPDPRKEAMVQMIVDQLRREGEPPKPTHIVRAWQEQYGVALNYNTAVKLIERAESLLVN